jgi:hypothetical protein
MIEWLKLRGWVLPLQQEVIPNIIQGSPRSSGAVKEVHRLVFFGRLEERKGIKLFVSMINALGKNLPADFEVVFIGNGRGYIDSLPAVDWINRQSSNWTFPVHKHIGAAPADARALLRQPGNLIVLCSAVENMPYALAEAATAGIPLVTCNSGGIPEMLSQEHSKDIMINDRSVESLLTVVAKILKGRQAPLPVLTPNIFAAKQSWLKWHDSHFASHASRVNADVRRRRQQQTSNVVHVAVSFPNKAADVRAAICDRMEVKAPSCVLLLPGNYKVLNESRPVLNDICGKLHLMNASRIAAVTFGILLPDQSLTFPSSPSWMAYDGSAAQCSDDIPIMATHEQFCSTFKSQAKPYQEYNSWSYAHMLVRQRLMLVAYPAVVFQLLAYTHEGYGCISANPPAHRKFPGPSLLSLYANAEDVLLDSVIAPATKPHASLVLDAADKQNHRGWSYGWIDEGRFLPFTHTRHSESKLQHGVWQCRNESLPYIHLGYKMIHPCAQSNHCCGRDKAVPAIQYSVNSAHMQSSLEVVFDVFPRCGDGLSVSMLHLHKLGVEQLFNYAYKGNASSPIRETLNFKLNLLYRDTLILLVDPHQNHDCDGVHVAKLEVWGD